MLPLSGLCMQVFVLKMMRMPPCPYCLDEKRQYNAVVKNKTRKMAWEYQDRGWPVFESNISNMRGVGSMSRLEFADEAIKVEHLFDIYRCQANGLPMHTHVLSSSDHVQGLRLCAAMEQAVLCFLYAL